MKQKSTGIIIFFIVIMGIQTEAFSQRWYPYSTIVRYGNPGYYPIDSLTEENLEISAGLDPAELTNRFFDVKIRSDSIGITIQDTALYFEQNWQPNTKGIRRFLFYHYPRTLRSSDIKIKYMKMYKVSEELIVADVKIKGNRNELGFNRIEQVRIPKNEVEGVYLGNGGNYRTFMLGIFVASLIVVHFI